MTSTRQPGEAAAKMAFLFAKESDAKVPILVAAFIRAEHSSE